MTEFSDTLDSIYGKVNAEHKALGGWYGDVFSAVVVDWDNITAITKYRIVHGHDLNGVCRKRKGEVCGDTEKA